MLLNTISETREEYKFRKAILNKTIRKEERLLEKEMLRSLEKAHSNPRKLIEKCKEIKRCYKP